MKHCCDTMSQAVNHHCPKHETVFECPDALIYYSEQDGEYGLIIHDGGTSYQRIAFCPWCGTKFALMKGSAQ
jgi:hypothetical protein